MSRELAAYLEFYRDLGFTDLKASQPEVIAEPELVGTPEAAAAAAEQPRPAAAVPDVEPAPAPAPPPAATPPAAMSAAPAQDPLPILDAIRADIGDDCRRCRLHQGRTNLVFGVGDPNAELVFVGEGPGADEDAQGIPFVGRAGQLLTQMIDRTAEGEGIPIKRENVYICNVVKCRPPGNRAPEPDEMEICGQFLARQLKAIRPKAICVLGSTAAKALLDTKVGITKLRGEWQEWDGIRVMPTFHPSYLLRAYNKEAKRQAWEDLKKVLHYVYG